MNHLLKLSRIQMKARKWLESLSRGKSEAGDAPRTGKELVDFWQREGLIGTRTDIQDSQEYARALRAQADYRWRSFKMSSPFEDKNNGPNTGTSATDLGCDL
jgi:hypothetical protein